MKTNTGKQHERACLICSDNWQLFFIRSLLNLQHETKKQKSVKVALLCKQRKSHWDGIQETQCKPKEETVTSVSTPTAHLDECAGPCTEGLALPAVSWLDSAWGSLLHVISPLIVPLFFLPLLALSKKPHNENAFGLFPFPNGCDVSLYQNNHHIAGSCFLLNAVTIHLEG